MTLNNEIEISDLLKAVDQAAGDVWLLSIQGDKYNLKSVLSRYVALGAMIANHANDLELFCDKKSDEQYFMKFFKQHPNTV